ncbi:MAG: hypothetical protein ACLVB5_06425 [Christensenellales bacterium]
MFVYALDAHGIKGYELKKHFFMPGGEVDKAHPFVSACVKKAGELLDRAEEPMPFGASCEQCFLVEAGAATVIIGPGSLDQANNTVDEYQKRATAPAPVRARAVSPDCDGYSEMKLIRLKASPK